MAKIKSIGKNYKRKKKQVNDFMLTTIQYCTLCEEITIFKYDNNIGHKVCIECGKRNFNME